MGISEYGKPFKRRLQRKKTPKIDLYPDSKSLIYPPIQGKENRLPQRPINSAIGTGGLDFLIACALLILCHSLFEVVIEPVLDTCHVAVSAVGVNSVEVVIDGNIPHIVFRKSEVDIKPGQRGISAQSG